MPNFFKPSSYKRVKSFLIKNDFDIREDGGHLVATHSSDKTIVIAVPRHTKLKNGLTNDLCKRLIELGFEENDVRKSILK